MTIVLNLAYLILGLLVSPFILFKLATSARWRAGFAQRLGNVPRREGQKPCVWIHAVSVGEVNAVRPLVKLIEQERPGWDVRVSTTTNTGQKVAREQFGPDRCFYLPLDLSFIVRRTLRRIRPNVLVLVELELWPNLLRMARRKKIPVVVVNGRMREERVGRYRAGRFLFAPAFDPATGNLLCVQNETYRDRFQRAGAPAEMIRVTGTMKYDAVRVQPDPSRVNPLRAALGIGPEDRVWIAACTWPGEEEISLRAHRKLLEMEPGLRLIIAPRHIERAADVVRTVERAGFACRLRSKGAGATGPQAVCVLDTVGELGYLYELAEFVFVGKSLTARGGHNMLEPAALGVVPVFGPWTDNFEAEARLLLDAGGAVRVADEAALAGALLRLLQDAPQRRERAQRCREAVLRRQGASRRHFEVLRQLLSQESRS